MGRISTSCCNGKEGTSRSGNPETDAKTQRSAEVKKNLSWVVLIVLLSFGLYYSSGDAQGPVRPAAAPAAVGGPRLALLDVGRIFKNHARFKSMMEDMKADVQQAEARIKAEREAIAKLGERLQEFRKGTQEYKSLEEELARRQADLSVQMSMQRNEFLQREARIYHNVYQEIWQATDYFCRQHSIDMVLRFSSEAVDPDRPDSVLTNINKPVVWYDQGLDITDAILQELNRSGIPPVSADRRNQTTPTRPVAPFNNPR